MTDRDIFRPTRQPAQSLYDAFQSEAAQRKSRTVEQWTEAERRAVWSAARDYAQMHGLRIPAMAEVERCERYAMGSADYGSKWAYSIERKMREGEKP